MFCLWCYDDCTTGCNIYDVALTSSTQGEMCKMAEHSFTGERVCVCVCVGGGGGGAAQRDGCVCV